MGLFDKLKQQAMSSLNDLSSNLQEKLNGVGNPQNEQDYKSSQFEPVQQEPAGDNSSGRAEQTPPPVTQVMPSQTAPQQTTSVQKSGDEGIYGNYMEHLIEMALADGELTEKEKQVLFKKAEANGIDLDEFEMVLEARLYEKQKSMQSFQKTAQNPISQSHFIGVERPRHDGDYGESWNTPKFSFDVLQNKIEKLQDQKDKLADKVIDLEEEDRNEKPKGFWKSMLDDGNMALWDAERRVHEIDDRILNSIKQSPVPTRKDDMIDFLTRATPLAKPATKSLFFSSISGEDLNIAKAWKEKCEQIIMKARSSMKEDISLLEEIEKYARELKIK